MNKILNYTGLLLVCMLLSGNILAQYPPPPPGGVNSFTIKLFLQGFYIGNETMRQVHEVKDGGLIAPRWDSPIAERFTLELHTPGQYGQIGSTYEVAGINLLENGTAVVNLPNEGVYYLTIRTRNHLETVSAVAVDLSNTNSYDFTTTASQAYGSNQVQLESGVFGIYAGDVNQDGVVDGSDAALIYNQLRIAAIGYISTDIDGNGVVDGSDNSIAYNNLRVAVSKIVPN
ncbi:MAG: hypothetical protein IH597_13415 [Bacteroidales bacterium]|nr:hypothetical protein [Bacteroidales bacterium]